jgi:hypothetical protein
VAQAGSCQHLSTLDLGPLLDQNLCDPLAVVEGEIHLTQIDISIQHQSVLVLVGVFPETPESKSRRSGDQDQKSYDEKYLVLIEE